MKQILASAALLAMSCSPVMHWKEYPVKEGTVLRVRGSELATLLEPRVGIISQSKDEIRFNINMHRMQYFDTDGDYNIDTILHSVNDRLHCVNLDLMRPSVVESLRTLQGRVEPPKRYTPPPRAPQRKGIYNI